MFLHLQGKIISYYIYNIYSTSNSISIWLYRADILDYGNAFNLTMYLTNETDYIVWSRVSSSIAYVRDMLSGDTDIYPKFQVISLLVYL